MKSSPAVTAKKKERISSYYQLSALHKDWGLLSKNSEKIEEQRANQQKYILKILYGPSVINEYGRKESYRRGIAEKMAISSVTSDLIGRKYSGETDAYNSVCGCVPEGNHVAGNVDLSYVDFSGLVARFLYLPEIQFKYSNLSESRINNSCFRKNNFTRANLTGCVIVRTCLQNAVLRGAWLTRANLNGANLKHSNLVGAKFFEATLKGAQMEGAIFLKKSSGSISQQNDREIIVNQLKVAKSLPAKGELLKAKDFDQELVDEIFKAHQQYRAEREKSEEPAES